MRTDTPRGSGYFPDSTIHAICDDGTHAQHGTLLSSTHHCLSVLCIASNRITPMVDCFDRIAVQMTEIALAPILQLAERAVMTSATVRLPSNGQRILLTVSKRFPNGEDAVPVFAWKLERGSAKGQTAGVIASSPAIRHYPLPEDAFWAAVDALRDVNLGQQSAG